MTTRCTGTGSATPITVTYRVSLLGHPCRPTPAYPPLHRQSKSHELLHKVERLLTQQKKDKNKLYSLHAPEVECISKGKVRQPYEFGVKVSVATTHKEGLVVGMRSLPGNPHDGHTLHEALEQLEILTDHRPKEVFIDLGYRGHSAPADIKVYHRNLKRSITARLKRDIKRRSAIEPVIGHMKNDGRLRRNCNEALRTTKRLGRTIWRQWSGYHRCSLVETKMRCFKLLGESVMARDFDRQVAELQIRAALLNRFTQLGIPETERVG